MSSQTFFGKYQIIAPLAKGGMGEIFLAKQHGPAGFTKLVVIKTLPEHRRDSQKYVQMLMAEAAIVGWLNHSNIAQVYDVGQTDETVYIAMEFVAGKSLRKLLRKTQANRQPIPLSYIISIFSQLCDGLAFAHEAKDIHGSMMQLIHRDINPNNILISFSGEVKLIDFGIAKRNLAAIDQTRQGTIKGTVVYMSPEQALGRPLTYHSDIFSVGICLYEALTDVNPFYRETLPEALASIRSGHYPPLTDHNANLYCFIPIIANALAKEPNNRYNSARLLARDLRMLLEDNIIAKDAISFENWLQQLFAADIAALHRLLERTDFAKIAPPQFAPAAKNKRDTLANPVQKWDFLTTASFLNPTLLWRGLGLLLIISGLGLLTEIIYLGRQNHTPISATLTPTKQVNLSPQKNPIVKAPSIHQNHSTSKNLLVNSLIAHPLKNKHNNRHLLGMLELDIEPNATIVSDITRRDNTLLLEHRKGVIGIFPNTNQDEDSAPPFSITLSYKIKRKNLELSIQSNPKSLIKGAGGIVLGHTPLVDLTIEHFYLLSVYFEQTFNLLHIRLRYRPVG